MRSLVVTVSLVVSECLKTVSEMHAACPFTFVTFKMYYFCLFLVLICVRRPCNVLRHVTARYKLSFYYYYYLLFIYCMVYCWYPPVFAVWLFRPSEHMLTYACILALLHSRSGP